MLSIQTFILLLLLIAGAVVAIIYFFSSQMKNLKKDLASDSDAVLLEWLKDMKSSVEKNSDVLEKQLSSQRDSMTSQLKDQRVAMDKRTKLIWERLEKTADVISGVQKHLGGLQEFSSDMKDLSNVLKSPKLRGGLGEQFLYDVLANFLPKDLYKTQYKFRDGSVADAVIKIEKGLIPIDSKFPMENFKLMLTQETQKERDSAKKAFIKDVKKRIDEIASKYLLPEEGTTDQAIMYIPSENIYYELIVNTAEIEEYAKAKDIIMASPNTLSYFLKVLLVGYQQQELEQHAGEILKALAGIQVEAKKFDADLGVLDGHINRTTKSMDNVKSKYQRLFGKIESVHRIGESSKEALIDGD